MKVKVHHEGQLADKATRIVEAWIIDARGETFPYLSAFFIAVPPLSPSGASSALHNRSTFFAQCRLLAVILTMRGEGMVVKPRSYLTRGRKGLAQPAVKCRGPEYLRIIYGPEYDAREHLARLRSRSPGKKRSLAIREFVLGAEALRRFVAGEPLRRVQEPVFGILALESEPMDPRL